MLSALLEHLVEKPDQYQDEMVVFLYDEFGGLGIASRSHRGTGEMAVLPRELFCVCGEGA